MSMLRKVLGLVAALLVVPAMVGCNPCEDDGTLVVCGAFGELAFAVTPPSMGGQVQWPPVATERESILLSTDWELTEIDASGGMNSVHTFDGQASAPSLGEDGTAYLVVPGSQAHAIDPAAGPSSEPSWITSVPGDSAAAPPAVGDGELHLSVQTNWREGRTLLTLDAQTGAVTKSREGGSPAAVACDGSLRYLVEPQDCGATFNAMVAENPDGSIRWRHDEPSGIRDFAPGPDGETYIVTGDRNLVRLSDQGASEWSFSPDCEECTVAAAPTVTDDSVYFPVWQGWSQTPGCDEPEPQFPDSIDPLYALDRQGNLKWSYDGFSTMGNRYSALDAMGGVLALSNTQTIKHHPAGRPTVADDGTLYVATDGAMVALDANGEELGYAMYNAQLGEVRSGDGGLMTSSTWLNTGFSPSPVLSPAGKLYMWDGTQIRAFETGKAAAPIPWNAPFGGHRNDGRVRR